MTHKMCATHAFPTDCSHPQEPAPQTQHECALTNTATSSSVKCPGTPQSIGSAADLLLELPFSLRREGPRFDPFVGDAGADSLEGESPPALPLPCMSSSAVQIPSSAMVVWCGMFVGGAEVVQFFQELTVGVDEIGSCGTH
jgi:hypothetical protein